jgi:hypothetical protein
MSASDWRAPSGTFTLPEAYPHHPMGSHQLATGDPSPNCRTGLKFTVLSRDIYKLHIQTIILNRLRKINICYLE